MAMKKTFSSHIYREYMRCGLRLLMGREHEALLWEFGETIGTLCMNDLEALFELVFGVNPRDLAPPSYRAQRV